MSFPCSIPAEHQLDLEKGELHFNINLDFPDIESHFPGQPLVPAFAQLIWAQYLVSKLDPSDLKGFHSVKFKSPIIPPTNVTVVFKDSSTFEIHSAGKLSTLGKIKRAN